MSGHKKKYCIFGCTLFCGNSIPIHRFPNPNKRPDLFATWVLAVGGTLTESDIKKIYSNKRICDQHFESNCKTVSGRLVWSAVPTVNLNRIEPSLSTFVEVDHNYCYYRRELLESRPLVSITNTSDTITAFGLEKLPSLKSRSVHNSSILSPSGSSTTHQFRAGSSVVRENNGDQSANTTNVTPQSESNNDKNTTSELINRRTSCDTTDSVNSSGIREDPLAIETDEVADRTVSDSESYLEDIDEEISEWSDGIFEEFAQKWEPILKDGLIKGTQDEINSNYLFCKNLPSSKPPLLNTEIANLLTEEIKSRDNELVNKQSQLGHALAALGKAMTGLRTNTMEASDILETLNDVGELIADLHYLETEARRSLIVQELDNSLAEPLKDRVRDEYLFGQDVGEILKPPEVKTTASSITPRMISTFLNKKKVQSPAASSPVRQITKITVQKNVKRPAALTPGDQITKKLRQCIETSLTTLRTREEELSSDTGTAAPDPDPDQTTTDPTAALSQLNIQIYDENGQPLSPEQQPAPSLTNDTEFLEEDVENKDNEEGDICIILLDDASLT